LECLKGRKCRKENNKKKTQQIVVDSEVGLFFAGQKNLSVSLKCLFKSRETGFNQTATCRWDNRSLPQLQGSHGWVWKKDAG
jgi:hypothetical protein